MVPDTIRKTKRAVTLGTIVLALALAWPAWLAAAPENAVGNPLGLDLESGPLLITADELVAENQERTAKFSGNVHAVQKDASVRADRLTIWYSSDEGGKTGAAMDSAVRRIEARGNVRVSTPEFHSEADRAVYEADDQTLTLSGDKAFIRQGRSLVTGSRFVIQVGDGGITVQGDPGSRVEAILYPEDADADNNNQNEPEEASNGDTRTGQAGQNIQ
ncbi:MAG: LptA/OstA family protein [Desulfatibacillaceae bacterium]